MQNRRQWPRAKTYLGAKITFNNRMSVADCTVHNMFASGVRLTFHNTQFVPDEFELHIASRQQTYRAAMKWRRFGEGGAQIEASGDEKEKTSFEQEVFIRQLKNDNAALRRSVQERQEGY